NLAWQQRAAQQQVANTNLDPNSGDTANYPYSGGAFGDPYRNQQALDPAAQTEDASYFGERRSADPRIGTYGQVTATPQSGQAVSGFLGSHNEFIAHDPYINPNGYEWGGQYGGAASDIDRYRGMGSIAQGRQGVQMNLGDYRMNQRAEENTR